MKEMLSVLLAAILVGCQTVSPRDVAPDANPAIVRSFDVEQKANGFTVAPILHDATCPTTCQVTMTPNITMAVVYDGSGEDGAPPGWPGPPDGPGGPTPPHDSPPGGHKYCELYALTGDLYLCGKPPKCPGPVFSPKHQEFLEVAVITFGAACNLKLFRPRIVRPVPELTLVAGTEFVAPSPPPPLGPPPPVPTHPRAILNVRKYILNADLVTVEFPQILRIDEHGYLVGSLAMFSAPTRINVVLRGSNPKGDVTLRFAINLVPAGNKEGGSSLPLF